MHLSFSFARHTAVLLTVLLPLAVAGAVHAQERAAGGTLSRDITWKKLQEQVAEADASAKQLDNEVNGMVACGKQKMFYSPSASGANAQGCVSRDEAVLNAVIGCNSQGKFYSRSGGCIAP